MFDEALSNPCRRSVDLRYPDFPQLPRHNQWAAAKTICRWHTQAQWLFCHSRSTKQKHAHDLPAAILRRIASIYAHAYPCPHARHIVSQTPQYSSEERIVLHAVTPSALTHKLVVQDIDVEGDGMSGGVVQRKVFERIGTQMVRL